MLLVRAIEAILSQPVLSNIFQRVLIVLRQGLSGLGSQSTILLGQPLRLALFLLCLLMELIRFCSDLGEAHLVFFLRRTLVTVQELNFLLLI